MKISGFIQKKKEAFKRQRLDSEKMRIAQETERLKIERQRQAELQVANQERAKLERDVQNISAFNAKYPTPPNKARAFAKGLGKALNKGREGVAKAKSAGYLKGADYSMGAGSNNAFGNSGRDVFSGSSDKKMADQPRKPKKKVTVFY